MRARLVGRSGWKPELVTGVVLLLAALSISVRSEMLLSCPCEDSQCTNMTQGKIVSTEGDFQCTDYCCSGTNGNYTHTNCTDPLMDNQCEIKNTTCQTLSTCNKALNVGNQTCVDICPCGYIKNGTSSCIRDKRGTTTKKPTSSTIAKPEPKCPTSIIENFKLYFETHDEGGEAYCVPTRNFILATVIPSVGGVAAILVIIRLVIFCKRRNRRDPEANNRTLPAREELDGKKETLNLTKKRQKTIPNPYVKKTGTTETVAPSSDYDLEPGSSSSVAILQDQSEVEPQEDYENVEQEDYENVELKKVPMKLPIKLPKAVSKPNFDDDDQEVYENESRDDEPQGFYLPMDVSARSADPKVPKVHYVNRPQPEEEEQETYEEPAGPAQSTRIPQQQQIFLELSNIAHKFKKQKTQKISSPKAPERPVSEQEYMYTDNDRQARNPDTGRQRRRVAASVESIQSNYADNPINSPADMDDDAKSVGEEDIYENLRK